MILIRSEDVKELLFQGSSDLMLYLDTFGRILKINKAGLAFSGFSEEEVIGKMLWKIPGVFSKRNVPKYLKVFKNTLTGKETKGFLGNLNDKTGKTHLMDFSTYLIKENRKIKYVLVISKDVGEQKETEEKYRLICEHTSDLVALATFTLNPTFTYVSPSHKTVLGYEPMDLIGKSIFDFIHPDDRKKMRPLLKKYVSAKAKKFLTGKNKDITEFLELRFKDKSGNWHYLETTVNLMEKEILSVSRDVTKRKCAEEALQKSEEQFRNFVENSNDIIYTLNEKGVFLYVSSGWTRILGHDLKDVVGKPFAPFVHPDDVPVCFAFLKKVMETGQPQKGVEYRVKHLDGAWRWHTSNASCVKGKDGNILYYLGIARDITERKKVEEKIKQQNIKLKKLDRIKSNFLTVTSHELRTPMSAIKGYIQMLLKQSLGEITEEQKQALNIISRNTTRLDNLIQDILDVSRLESGTMKFIPEQTDLHKMIREISETIKSSADLKNIKINVDIEKGIPELTIDHERIQQVLMNLVNNAIKFSPQRTAINIRAKREEDDVLFEVQDFGRGIPKDKQEKVFETFYQVDSSTDLKFGGAGLGLSISRGIVLAHGGRIWVESTLGKCSTFRFTLPIQPVIDIENKFKKIDIFGLELKE